MADNTRLAREVGAKIKYLRQKRGLSQEALALSCDMNPAFLGHVERGMRSPTLNTLQRICDGLGITLTELLLTELDATAASTGCAAAIQHVTDRMRQLTPSQAAHIADMVEQAVQLLDDNSRFLILFSVYTPHWTVFVLLQINLKFAAKKAPAKIWQEPCCVIFTFCAQVLRVLCAGSGGLPGRGGWWHG